MRTKKETKKEAVQEATPLKEVKKRGRKPATKKKQGELATESPKEAVAEQINEPAVDQATAMAVVPTTQATNATEQALPAESSTQKTAQAEKPEKPKKARSTRKSKTSAATPAAEMTSVTEKTKSTEKVTEDTSANQVPSVSAIEETPKAEHPKENPLPTPPAPTPAPSKPTETQETQRHEQPRQEVKVLPLPLMTIRNIIDLAQAPQRAIILSDQQIQTLTLEEIEKRHKFLETTLCNILDYDIVISDTNIWLELLVGHTSSHSDPRFNARLQFERQLEFISKLTHYRGGRFMIMGETYEEIDRFAAMQDPTNHREADWTDNIVCLNAAARLAKRLILAQQRENRLRIEGIGAESHHAAFADPAIVRKVAELFAQGKKVLLLTNDASVAIRSLGICDDLQRHNNITDEEWDEHYAPLRPMVFTFEDLKLLDNYTRQYHYIQMAAGQPWMVDVPRKMERAAVASLTLWQDAFRPGDKHRGDNLFTEQEANKAQQKLQQNQQKQGQQKQQQQKQQQKQKQQRPEPKQQEQQGTIPPPPHPNEAQQGQFEESAVEVNSKNAGVNGLTSSNPAETQEQQKQEQTKSRQRSRRRPQKSKQQSEAQQAQNAE